MEARQAASGDVATVCSILQDAANWLDEIGQPLWRAGKLSEETIQADVTAGYYYLFEVEAVPAGTLKFQLRDDLFWPDLPPSEAAFIHRLAIRRAFSGGELSAAMVRWAIAQARSHDRRYLRLDCEASRPKLRAFYERMGLTRRDDRQVGPYFVSRYERKT